MAREILARARQSGQVLAGVILLVMVLLIMVPAMVQWVQIETKSAVRDQKKTTAFNLAEAAVERGMWKLKSSTSTFATAQAGTAIAGYNFDVTYTDIPGGSYRISMTSSVYNGAAVMLVWGEGRDNNRSEMRAVKAIYQNLSIPGAIISAGNLIDTGGSAVHWGPIMAMGTLTETGTVPNYPRLLSKQTALPMDTNGLTPPNTDNVQWWSGYDVPELPMFDFTALRSSAAATNTLNCNGSTTGAANIPCGSACINCVVKNMYKDPRYNSNYVWYWDNNVVINDPGTNGTFIIRGNMLTNGGDYYGSYGAVTSVNMHVPTSGCFRARNSPSRADSRYPRDIGWSTPYRIFDTQAIRWSAHAY
jgi:Tfp pilus assembly protein PilX